MKRNTSSRTRQSLARVGIVLIMAAMIAGTAGCLHFMPSRNLEIRTWYDLDQVRRNLSGHHRLMNDLDASTPGYDELAGPEADGGKGWRPIGELHPADPYFPFRGTFDGQGHEIRDLFIRRWNEAYVGLFAGIASPEAIIENLGVVNARVVGKYDVGGLVGLNMQGTVRDCYVTGTVFGERGGWVIGLTGGVRVGGLVGYNSAGTVNNSHFSGDVIGGSQVGGLVGVNDYGGTILDCYSTGSIEALSLVGGLVGYISSGSIENSHYSLDDVLINGHRVITIGALSGEDFEDWLNGGRFLNVE